MYNIHIHIKIHIHIFNHANIHVYALQDAEYRPVALYAHVDYTEESAR